jgi:flagellar hook-associated protein 3 FlgL
MMRVSTQQFYFQNSNQLANKQSQINEQVNHISSGKRVLTAQDDAVSYGTLSGYKDQLASIENYKRNINQAKSRNNAQENAFMSGEEILLQLKDLFLQANNGALNNDDLAAIAKQAENAQVEMINMANTTDETGGYIFSGYQIDKKPFSLQPDNSVIYNGDNGVRKLQIAKNVAVDINQPGDQIFEKVKNPIGDFSASYNSNTSGIEVNTAIITNRGTYNSTTNPPDYNFNFTSATDLNVTDSLGNVVFNTTAYVPGQAIAFNGIEVQLSGNPLPGDNFDLTPAENISIFDTIKSAIDWMKAGTSPANSAQHQVDYDTTLAQIESALSHMTTRRSEAGTNLLLIDNQESKHLDTELYINKGKSSIEDLDYATAITNYEQSKTALQAAQQLFTQIQKLTLFNFI